MCGICVCFIGWRDRSFCFYFMGQKYRFYWVAWVAQADLRQWVEGYFYIKVLWVGKKHLVFNKPENIAFKFYRWDRYIFINFVGQQHNSTKFFSLERKILDYGLPMNASTKVFQPGLKDLTLCAANGADEVMRLGPGSKLAKT